MTGQAGAGGAGAADDLSRVRRAVRGELGEGKAGPEALVSGGVYLSSPPMEVVRPFPNVSLSVPTFSAGNGLYTYPGGTVTATLTGKYVKITDTCGSTSQASQP